MGNHSEVLNRIKRAIAGALAVIMMIDPVATIYAAEHETLFTFEEENGYYILEGEEGLRQLRYNMSIKDYYTVGKQFLLVATEADTAKVAAYSDMLTEYAVQQGEQGEKPVTDEPVTDEPVTDDTAIGDTVTDEPVTDETVILPDNMDNADGADATGDVNVPEDTEALTELEDASVPGSQTVPETTEPEVVTDTTPAETVPETTPDTAPETTVPESPAPEATTPETTPPAATEGEVPSEETEQPTEETPKEDQPEEEQPKEEQPEGEKPEEEKPEKLVLTQEQIAACQQIMSMAYGMSVLSVEDTIASADIYIPNEGAQTLVIGDGGETDDPARYFYGTMKFGRYDELKVVSMQPLFDTVSNGAMLLGGHFYTYGTYSELNDDWGGLVRRVVAADMTADKGITSDSVTFEKVNVMAVLQSDKELVIEEEEAPLCTCATRCVPAAEDDVMTESVIDENCPVCRDDATKCTMGINVPAEEAEADFAAGGLIGRVVNRVAPTAADSAKAYELKVNLRNVILQKDMKETAGAVQTAPVEISADAAAVGGVIGALDNGEVLDGSEGGGYSNPIRVEIDVPAGAATANEKALQVSGKIAGTGDVGGIIGRMNVGTSLWMKNNIYLPEQESLTGKTVGMYAGSANQALLAAHDMFLYFVDVDYSESVHEDQYLLPAKEGYTVLPTNHGTVYNFTELKTYASIENNTLSSRPDFLLLAAAINTMNGEVMELVKKGADTESTGGMTYAQRVELRDELRGRTYTVQPDSGLNNTINLAGSGFAGIGYFENEEAYVAFNGSLTGVAQDNGAYPIIHLELDATTDNQALFPLLHGVDKQAEVAYLTFTGSITTDRSGTGAVAASIGHKNLTKNGGVNIHDINTRVNITSTADGEARVGAVVGWGDFSDVDSAVELTFDNIHVAANESGTYFKSDNANEQLPDTVLTDRGNYGDPSGEGFSNIRVAGTYAGGIIGSLTGVSQAQSTHHLTVALSDIIFEGKLESEGGSGAIMGGIIGTVRTLGAADWDRQSNVNELIPTMPLQIQHNSTMINADRILINGTVAAMESGAGAFAAELSGVNATLNDISIGTKLSGTDGVAGIAQTAAGEFDVQSIIINKRANISVTSPNAYSGLLFGDGTKAWIDVDASQLTQQDGATVTVDSTAHYDELVGTNLTYDEGTYVDAPYLAGGVLNVKLPTGTSTYEAKVNTSGASVTSRYYYGLAENLTAVKADKITGKGTEAEPFIITSEAQLQVVSLLNYVSSSLSWKLLEYFAAPGYPANSTLTDKVMYLKTAVYQLQGGEDGIFDLTGLSIFPMSVIGGDYRGVEGGSTTIKFNGSDDAASYTNHQKDLQAGLFTAVSNLNPSDFIEVTDLVLEGTVYSSHESGAIASSTALSAEEVYPALQNNGALYVKRVSVSALTSGDGTAKGDNRDDGVLLGRMSGGKFNVDTLELGESVNANAVVGSVVTAAGDTTSIPLLQFRRVNFGTTLENNKLTSAFIENFNAKDALGYYYYYSLDGAQYEFKVKDAPEVRDENGYVTTPLQHDPSGKGVFARGRGHFTINPMLEGITEGYGTEAYPYLLSSPRQLHAIAEAIRSWDTNGEALKVLLPNLTMLKEQEPPTTDDTTEGGTQTTTCTCTAKCTEQAQDTSCPVCQSDINACEFTEVTPETASYAIEGGVFVQENGGNKFTPKEVLEHLRTAVYRLKDNIDMSTFKLEDTDMEKTDTDGTPYFKTDYIGIGTYAHPFAGKFNGRGYTVLLDDHGLFGYVDGLSISNMNITTPYNKRLNVSGAHPEDTLGEGAGHDDTTYIGSIADVVLGGDNYISNVNVSTEFVVDATRTDLYVGGYVGYVEAGTVILSNLMDGFADDFTVYSDMTSDATVSNPTDGETRYAGICPKTKDGYILYEGDSVEDSVVLSGFNLMAGKVNHEYLGPNGEAVYLEGDNVNWIYTVNETAGTTGLPTGMALDEKGRLYGTPATGGTFTFSVSASKKHTGTGVPTDTDSYDYGTYTLVIRGDDAPAITFTGETEEALRNVYYGSEIELQVTTPLYELNENDPLNGAPPASVAWTNDEGKTMAPYSGQKAMTWNVVRGSSLVEIVRSETTGYVTIKAKESGSVIIDVTFPADNNYMAGTRRLEFTVLSADLTFQTDDVTFRHGAAAMPAEVGKLWLANAQKLVEEYNTEYNGTLQLAEDGRLLVSYISDTTNGTITVVPGVDTFLTGFIGLTNVPASNFPDAIKNYTPTSCAGTYLMEIGVVNFKTDATLASSYDLSFDPGIVTIERRDVVEGDYKVVKMAKDESGNWTITDELAQVSDLGWYNCAVAIVPAGEYNKISTDGADWQEALTFTGEHSGQVVFYLNNSNDDTGNTASLKAVIDLRIDMTAPVVKPAFDKTAQIGKNKDNDIALKQELFGGVYLEDLTLLLNEEGGYNSDPNLAGGKKGSGVNYLEYYFAGVNSEYYTKTAAEMAAAEVEWTKLARTQDITVKETAPEGETAHPEGIWFVRAWDFAGNVSAPYVVAHTDPARDGAYIIDGTAPALTIGPDAATGKLYYEGQYAAYATGIPTIPVSVEDSHTGLSEISYSVSYLAPGEQTAVVKEGVLRPSAVIDSVAALMSADMAYNSETYFDLTTATETVRPIDLNEFYGTMDETTGKKIAPDGVYTIIVEALDNAGNRTEQTVVVSKDSVVPVVSLTSAQAEINMANDGLVGTAGYDAHDIQWHQKEYLTVKIENYQDILERSGVQSIVLSGKYLDEAVSAVGNPTYAASSTTVQTLNGEVLEQALGHAYNTITNEVDTSVTTEAGSVVLIVDKSAQYDVTVATNSYGSGPNDYLHNAAGTTSASDDDARYDTQWIDSVRPTLDVSGVKANNGGAYTFGHASKENVTVTAGFKTGTTIPRSITYLTVEYKDGENWIKVNDGTPIELTRDTDSFSLPEFTVETGETAIHEYRFLLTGDMGNGYASDGTGADLAGQKQEKIIWLDKNTPQIQKVQLNNGLTLISEILETLTGGTMFKNTVVTVTMSGVDNTPVEGTSDLHELSVEYYDDSGNKIAVTPSDPIFTSNPQMFTLGSYPADYYDGKVTIAGGEEDVGLSTYRFELPNSVVDEFAGTMELQVTDLAGNTSEAKKTEQQIIVDTKAPTFKFEGSQSDVWAQNDAPVKITELQDTGVYQSGIDKIVFWVMGEGFDASQYEKDYSNVPEEKAQTISLRKGIENPAENSWNKTELDPDKVTDLGNGKYNIKGTFYAADGVTVVGTDGDLLFRENGEHYIFVRLYDQAGNFTTKMASYKKDDTIPKVTDIALVDANKAERVHNGSNYITGTEAVDPVLGTHYKFDDETNRNVITESMEPYSSGSYAFQNVEDLYGNLTDALRLAVESVNVSGKPSNVDEGKTISPYLVTLEGTNVEGEAVEVTTVIPRNSTIYDWDLTQLWTDAQKKNLNGTEFTLTVQAGYNETGSRVNEATGFSTTLTLSTAVDNTADADDNYHIDMTVPNQAVILNEDFFAGKDPATGLNKWYNATSLKSVYVGFDNTDAPIPQHGASEKLQYAIYRNRTYLGDESNYEQANGDVMATLYEDVPAEWIITGEQLSEYANDAANKITVQEKDHYIRIPAEKAAGLFLEDGIYTLGLRIVDSSGQIGEYKQLFIYKDETPPEVKTAGFFTDSTRATEAKAFDHQLTTNYDGKYNTYDKFGTQVYAGAISEDNVCPEPYLTIYYCELAADGTVPAPGTQTGGEASWSAWEKATSSDMTILRDSGTEGKYAYYAIDLAGNISTNVKESRPYRVDTRTPYEFTVAASRNDVPVTNFAELANWVTQATKFTLTQQGASDELGLSAEHTLIDRFEYSWTKADGTTKTWTRFNTTGTLNELATVLNFAENGKYTLKLRALSYTGVAQEYAEQTIVVSKDNTAPVADISCTSGNNTKWTNQDVVFQI